MTKESFQDSMSQIITQLKERTKFDECFAALQNCDFSHSVQDQRLALLKAFAGACSNETQTECVYDFMSDKINKQDFYFTFLDCKYFPQVILGKIRKSSNGMSYLIEAIKEYGKVNTIIRSLRQSIFSFALLRKEDELCFEIIKSLNPINSKEDYVEFSNYCWAFIRLIVNNQVIGNELFNYIMNLTPLLKECKLNQLLNIIISFASLLKGKSVHQSALNFVKFVGKPKNLISKFELTTKFIVNNDLPLEKSPIMLKPYYMYDKWNISLERIAKMDDPSNIYNGILSLCDNNQKEALILLKQLPLRNSLSFYYIMATKGNENDFHDALEKAFSENLFDVIIPILEKIAKVMPVLLKPHLKSISKMDFCSCSELIPLLIKAEIIDFGHLWKYVKKYDLGTVKNIIREGISQIQRKSSSFENSRFIISVLRHYFCNVYGSINWCSVAEEYEDDLSIASTILINENNEDNSLNSSAKYLIQWRERFMEFMSRAPSNLHEILVIPFILLSTATNEIPIDKLKWVSSKLPTYQGLSESILEGFSLYELSKHIILQSKSQNELKELFETSFEFNEEKITTYSSIFIHAAMASVFGNHKIIQILVEALKSNHSYIVDGVKIALNILRINGFIFDESISDLINEIYMPLSDKIVGLLSKTSKTMHKNQNIEMSKEDQKIIDIIQSTNSMVSKSINIAIQNNTFNDIKSVKNHFLQVSIACFLLLPSRYIPQTSIDKCINLLNDPLSTYKHKKFAIYALSQVPSIPEINIDSILEQNLLKSLFHLAIKHNNNQLLYTILNLSNDFTLLTIGKSI